MEIRCIVCDWEWKSIEEEVYNWESCPNCDFLYKFTPWIEQMQNEIVELKNENGMLHAKIEKFFVVCQEDQQEIGDGTAEWYQNLFEK